MASVGERVNLFGVPGVGRLGSDPDVERRRLGDKGFGLARMAAEGLPVPPGFTLTTPVHAEFRSRGWTAELAAELDAGLAALEAETGRRLGDPESPLLLSVRSGAAASMPGMMDTVLNVGVTPAVETSLAADYGGPDFAADTHRRFLLSYAAVVGGLDHDVVVRIAADRDRPPSEVRAAIAAEGVHVPDDPRRQVDAAVRAVLESWDSARARAYRGRERIDDALGTAVTVQCMVFGNLDDDSGSGVAFTRCPSTGTPGLIGDFLPRSQGEDVVAGTHRTASLTAMRDRWPALYDELEFHARRLEHRSGDVMDIEFTVERGRLWLLQARVAKRSARAALRIAIDMAEDPDFPVDRAVAVERCRPHLDTARSALDLNGHVDVVATGVAASPGLVAGRLCVDVDEAVTLGDAGERVVLARSQTSPADVHGIGAAAGLVTTLGGMGSHAAIVARAWGIPAVVGIPDVEVASSGLRLSDRVIPVGAIVTVDGTGGRILVGDHTGTSSADPLVETIKTWAADLPS